MTKTIITELHKEVYKIILRYTKANFYEGINSIQDELKNKGFESISRCNICKALKTLYSLKIITKKTTFNEDTNKITGSGYFVDLTK